MLEHRHGKEGWEAVDARLGVGHTSSRFSTFSPRRLAAAKILHFTVQRDRENLTSPPGGGENLTLRHLPTSKADIGV